MKKYCNLDIKADWTDLLLRLKSKNIVLLNRTEQDFMLAWGTLDECIAKQGTYNAKTFQNFLDKHKNEYIFGYLSYDIKNDETRFLSSLKSNSPDNDLHFFVPKHVIFAKSGQLTYFGKYAKDEIDQFLTRLLHSSPNSKLDKGIQLSENVSEQDYLNNIEKIKHNIQVFNKYLNAF